MGSKKKRKNVVVTRGSWHSFLSCLTHSLALFLSLYQLFLFRSYFSFSSVIDFSLQWNYQLPVTNSKKQKSEWEKKNSFGRRQGERNFLLEERERNFLLEERERNFLLEEREREKNKGRKARRVRCLSAVKSWGQSSDGMVWTLTWRQAWKYSFSSSLSLSLFRTSLSVSLRLRALTQRVIIRFGARKWARGGERKRSNQMRKRNENGRGKFAEKKHFCSFLLLFLSLPLPWENISKKIRERSVRKMRHLGREESQTYINTLLRCSRMVCNELNIGQSLQKFGTKIDLLYDKSTICTIISIDMRVIE